MQINVACGVYRVFTIYGIAKLVYRQADFYSIFMHIWNESPYMPLQH